MSASEVSDQLRKLASPKRAYDLAWFFKTEPGGYGEGDKFLGLTVPQSRSVAARFPGLIRTELDQLFRSEYHEERFCALVILNKQFERAKDTALRQDLFEYYLSLYELGAINNWDLVDVSANRFGRQLLNNPDAIDILLGRARSSNLWIQRSAVILTFPFIAEYDLVPTMVVSHELIDHPHDLMHKAVGWALREAGKKDLAALRGFLSDHAATMPRTALRYAIEKLSETERQQWLRMRAQSQPARDH